MVIPTGLTTHFQHQKSTHSQHHLTPNTKNSLPTPKNNSLPTQKALFGVEGESIFQFPHWYWGVTSGTQSYTNITGKMINTDHYLDRYLT